MNRQDADTSNSGRLPSFRLGRAQPCVGIEASPSNPILKVEEIHVGTKIQDVQLGTFAKVALLIEVDLARLEANEGSKGMLRVTSSPPVGPTRRLEGRKPWPSIRTGALALWSNLKRQIRSKVPAWKADAWPWIAATLATLASAALLSAVVSPAARSRAPDRVPSFPEALPRSGSPLSEAARDLSPSRSSAALAEREPGERTPSSRTHTTRSRAPKRKRAGAARRAVAENDALRSSLYSGKDL